MPFVDKKGAMKLLKEIENLLHIQRTIIVIKKER